MKLSDLLHPWKPHRHAAVLGWPIDHSLSPRLHNYWLKQYGLEGTYEKIAVEPHDLAQCLHDIKTKGYRGVNLTVPLKEVALNLVDEIEPLAKMVGAINTIVVRSDGKLIGKNTDVYGFAQNLHAHRFRLNNGIALVLGAGGAARAVVAALKEMGAGEIRIMNRTVGHATKLAHDLGSEFVKVYNWADPNAFKHVDLLVNATSLGMTGQPLLNISLVELPEEAYVTDIVYKPLRTGLLQKAHQRGNPTIDGLGMLLHQARPAFHAFFGRDPEVTKELRDHVLQALTPTHQDSP